MGESTIYLWTFYKIYCEPSKSESKYGKNDYYFMLKESLNKRYVDRIDRRNRSECVAIKTSI